MKHPVAIALSLLTMSTAGTSSAHLMVPGS